MTAKMKMQSFKIQKQVHKMMDTINIRLLSNEDQKPYDLLLLADPSVFMLEKYLSASAVYVAEMDALIVGVYVLFPIDTTTVEIKNIAVAETQQGKGIGKQLLEHAIAQAKARGFSEIKIGTANSSIGQLALYQKMGFEMDSILKGFFIDNYPEPMFENGILVRDMVILKRKLA
jgi:ribosomal protein S18 acetylase RimI-like enzyme